MGQKTEFMLEDWDFPEEKTETSERSETSVAVTLNDDVTVLEESLDSQTTDTIEHLNDSSLQVQDNKLFINERLGGETDDLSQEELAFRRQIEDLFELLELEKKADKSDGVRVYQTDPSPSRPWRFH